jgi:hypothetical protein
MFSELAVHVDGLLGREAAQRLAAARDLASNLAQRERDLADRLDKAARVAESGRTLEDLLRMLAPDDEAKNIGPETVNRIETLLREADAGTLIRRMQEVEAMLRAGRVVGSQTEARQLAEQLEVLAQRLDALHRAVVAPQLESLMALEKRAAELRDRFKKLDSQAAISEWHRDADLLLQEFGRLKDRSASADRLAEAMRVEGWGTNVTRWDWSRVGGYYTGPTAYDVSMVALESELREEVREFVLRELVAASDEPTPPQYKELVERYFQVLSQQGSGAEGRGTPE